MAAVVVEVMIDVLAEAVADAVAEEVITETVATEITAAEDTIASEATAAYNSSITNGASDDVASEEAIESGYNKLNQYSYDLAEQWRTEVEANPKVELPNKNPITGQSYDDFSADAEPNQADIDDDSDAGKKLDCPGGDACVEAKQTLTQRFMNWVRTLGIVAAAGATIAIVVAQIIGFLSMWICRTFGGCNDCKTDSTGKCKPDCQAVGCDCKTFCEPQACQSMAKFIQWYRKNFVIIIIGSIILSALALLAFKSFTLLIILFIINVILYLLAGQLGNILTTVICNFDAAGCVFKTGKPNC